MEPKDVGPLPSGVPPFTPRTYAENQPEYRALPGVMWHGTDGRFTSRWTLTDEERARIAAGEDLYIAQLTFGGRLQPILPSVGILEQLPELAEPPTDR